jgi:5-(carboxyamino)imidazole ribonucleotide synthase
MKFPFYGKDFRLGILGGGQLGKMLIQQAQNYDVKISVLDPSADAPCAGSAHKFVQGRFDDFETVYAFGKEVDLLTIEIEHVNLDALEKLVSEGVAVHPSPSVLRIVQDKGLQKQFYRIHGIDTAPFVLVENVEEIKEHRSDFPFMQKLRKGGYDGRGVQALRSDEDIYAAMPGPSVLEKFVDFEKEISVIVARNTAGEIKTFPAVDMLFNAEANLVEYLFSPASLTPELQEKASDLAIKVAKALDLTGVLAVEMFLTKNGNLLVNEVAPRPHNSGHQTIEGNVNSQYEQHLRAILGLPLGDTSIIRPTVMVNLLGEKGFSGPVKYDGLEEVLAWPGVYVHLYGKTETRPFRKMGHVTIAAQSLDQAKELAKKVAQTLKVISI